MDIREFFKLNGNAAVALSGGVDSAVLLYFAKQYANRVKAYYVDSAFTPRFEYEDALKIAETLGAEIEVLSADVLSDSEVTANTAQRCYYCKKRIFKIICDAAGKDGFDCVLDGTNASDDTSDRPGVKALTEFGVRSPLRECAYKKRDIRELARKIGLHVSDKPSYACLATRIPTGTRITAELLSKTEAAENGLREMGFENFRVRYLSGSAKLEFGKKEFDLFSQNRNKIITLLSPYYDNVYLGLRERNDE